MGSDSPDNKPKKQSFGGRLLSAFNEAAKDVIPVVEAIKDKVVETASPVVENVKDTVHEFTSDEEPKRQWIGVLKDTAKDVRDDKKERAALIAGAIIPGGGFVYGAHRIHQYRKKHNGEADTPGAASNESPASPGAPEQPPAANDTPATPAPQRKQRPPRPPRQQ